LEKIMKKHNMPKARKSGLVVQDLNGETLIYDLDTHRALCLNQTSALVWQNCDGVKTVSDISSILAAGSKNAASEDLIWLALDQLKKENLIENSEELETKFEGMTRREAVRKVGMASLIALPVIAAITAPTMAQTGTVCGRTCNGNGQCAAPCPNCNVGSTTNPDARTCQA
jgi:hypothetical protein